MNKAILVLRHELLTTLRRRSFQFVAFGLPLLATLIVAVVAIVKHDAGERSGASAEPQQPEFQTEGYVDLSGTIQALPADIPQEVLVAFEDEAGAKSALREGDIKAYYLIPRQFIDEGEIFYVYPNSLPLKSKTGQDWMIRRTMLFNLLGGDAERTEFIWNPMNLETTSLAAAAKTAAEDRPSRLLRLLPAAMAALFYVFLATSSNILLKSVSSEKENRTIEVILLSVSPKQLLVGKMVGLGIASLLQTMMWIAAFCVIMRINGYAFDLSDAARIPLSVLGWTLVFFSLGFAVYGSLMAGVGALVPKVKEANHASYVAIAPLIVAYAVALLAPLAGAANSWLPVVLSMFPLTAPVVMMMRVTTGEVPGWQLLVSVILLMVTAYVIVTAVAAMFRAQYLLSGQPFSVVRFLRLMLARG